MSIEDRVIDILSQQLAVEPRKIEMNSDLVNDLGCDSLDGVEIVLELEEEFDIDIPDDRYEGVRTVGDVVKGIHEILSD